jgi:hypothetical protein
LPDVGGAALRSLRERRGWDKPRLAREFRKAADEPVAEPHALVRMIRDWERGRFAPSDRYLHLYRVVFPELAGTNGAGPAPDPAGVLAQTRQVPGRAELAALQRRALRSGNAELVTLAGALMSLQRQVSDLAAHLERLLGDDAGEAAGE